MNTAGATLLALGGFGSIAMLLWSAVAVAPLIIHFWNRRRYDEVPWAAMDFLLAAVRQDARRIRLEQLLLLLLRMAIPVALAVALADPVLSVLGTTPSQAPPQHHLLILDGSYSMNARSGEQTGFAAAKELARELVRGMPQGDGATLILMSAPPQVVIGTPAFDHEQILAEIDDLRLQHTTASLPDTLDVAYDLLRKAQSTNPRLQEQQVYFFTDLGKNSWQEVAAARVRRRIAQLADLAKLLLVDVGGSEASNLAVTSLQADRSVATVDNEVSFAATVKNFSGRAAEAVQVDFLVDGRLIQRQNVDVAADGDTAIRAAYRFDTVGEHAVEVRSGSDALEIDNYRYLSVPVTQSLRVLCVQGKPRAADHVAWALQPGPDAQGGITTRIVGDDALSEIDLIGEFDCLFLCNVGRFGREQASRFSDFLQSGRGIVFFLGDQVSLDNYNQRLGSDAPQRLLPARLDAVSASGEYAFDPLDYRHPIVTLFRGFERAGLLSTPVWRYVRATPYEPVASSVALAFTNGDPAILEASVGQGRVVMITTAASTESMIYGDGQHKPWTAFSVWPSFPPLVHEMLLRATGRRYENRNLRVGEPIVVQEDVASPSVTISLLSDSNQAVWEERIRTAGLGSRTGWSFDRACESGIYRAEYGIPPANFLLFAVNLDTTRESELTRLPAEMLPSQMELRAGLDPVDSTGDLTQRPSPLFQLALVAVAVLLLLETYVAWYLGSART